MGSGKQRRLSTYVALLRGINVGGNHKIPMAELATLFEDAGCVDVRTYIQSGNVVFRARLDTSHEVPLRISEAIRAKYGYSISVVLRHATELTAIVEENPFAAEEIEGKYLHVLCLSDTPSPEQVKALDPKRFAPDVFCVRGANVYIHFPSGTAKSKLNVAYFDRALATTSTMRNWNTVQKLEAMCAESA